MRKRIRSIRSRIGNHGIVIAMYEGEGLDSFAGRMIKELLNKIKTTLKGE